MTKLFQLTDKKILSYWPENVICDVAFFLLLSFCDPLNCREAIISLMSVLPHNLLIFVASTIKRPHHFTSSGNCPQNASPTDQFMSCFFTSPIDLFLLSYAITKFLIFLGSMSKINNLCPVVGQRWVGWK